MNDQKSPKGEMLTNIRNALIKPTAQPFPQVENISHIYKKSDEHLEIEFATNLTSNGSNFIFCESREEFLQNLKTLTKKNGWKHLFCWDKSWQDFFQEKGFRKVRIGKDLEKADAGITLCEALVARTGSVLISSGLKAGRNLSIFPPAHIVIAFTSQLVPDIKDALKLIRKKYEEIFPSQITLMTGPSRTADIEKTLVMGAHGPEEVYLFLIDKPGA